MVLEVCGMKIDPPISWSSWTSLTRCSEIPEFLLVAGLSGAMESWKVMKEVVNTLIWMRLCSIVGGGGVTQRSVLLMLNHAAHESKGSHTLTFSSSNEWTQQRVWKGTEERVNKNLQRFGHSRINLLHFNILCKWHRAPLHAWEGSEVDGENAKHKDAAALGLRPVGLRVMHRGRRGHSYDCPSTLRQPLWQ